MSIASEIARLQGVRQDIFDAIADKGVVVPQGSVLADCPGLISGISGVSAVPIPQTFVYKEVLGKSYKCIEIEPKVFFLLENLSYTDENIVMTSDFSSERGAAAAYYNYSASGDYLYYNEDARIYINSIKPSQVKNISSTYFNKLVNYMKSSISNWLGYSPQLDNTTLTTFVKDSQFNGYESWLGLLDIGIIINGYFIPSVGGWSNIPYGYNKPVYFGVTSSGSRYGEMINLKTGKELQFFSGDLGFGSCYPVRYFIDEN